MHGLDCARRCEFPLRALQAQKKWHVRRSRTFGAAWAWAVPDPGLSAFSSARPTAGARSEAKIIVILAIMIVTSIVIVAIRITVVII